MPAFSRNARGLEPSRPCANDDDSFARLLASRDNMWLGPLASGRGIVDTSRTAVLVNPVEAIRGADARADLVFALLEYLPHDVRIGDVGAGHRDHIELA